MNLSLRTYLLLLLIAVLGIIGEWTDPVLLQTAYVLLGATVLLLGLEWLIHQKTAPVIVYRFPKRALLGCLERGQFIFRNTRHFSHKLKAQVAVDPTITHEGGVINLMLPMHSETEVLLEYRAHELGDFAAPTLYSRILGFLGFAWWPKRYDFSETLQVVPLRDPRARPHVAGKQLGHVLVERPASGHEFLKLRPYTPGDPIRWIDWKTTAKQNLPYVKLFNEELATQILLLVDCGRTSGLECGSLTYLGHAVNTASSFGHHACLLGHPLGLIAYDQSIAARIPITSRARILPRLHKTLRSIRPSKLDANPVLAITEAQKLLKRRGLIILFSMLETQTAAEQLETMLFQITRRHTVIVVSLRHREVESLYRHGDQTIHSPYRQLAAQELEWSVKRVLNRIRHFGVHVIHTSDDRAIEAIIRKYEQLRRHRIID